MKTSKDYRNSSSCPSLSEVAMKKAALEKKIREKHKKVKILYDYVKDRHGDFLEEFAEIYNYKCAYCGATLKFIGPQLFEVDHFICEAAFPNNTQGRAEAGKIENLAYSCYSCNRGKSNLYIKNGYAAMLMPDDNSIAKIFVRNEQYYITINANHLDDKFIQAFYDKLFLGSEVRRLDFLLLEMDSLMIRLRSNKPELANKLEQCSIRLLQKRNYTLL